MSGREHDHSEHAQGRRPIVRVVQVTEVRFVRGHGCCEASPAREVAAYYEGNRLLFESDPSPSPSDALQDVLEDCERVMGVADWDTNNRRP